jgi:hypothetical protein
MIFQSPAQVINEHPIASRRDAAELLGSNLQS